MGTILRLIGIPLAIAAIATMIWSFSGGNEKNFEDVALRAALTYEMRDQCPLSETAVETESVELLSICSTFGIAAYTAAKEDPETMAPLFALYGKLEEFRHVVDHYGWQALAVIQYFRERESTEFVIRVGIGEMWDKLWGEGVLEIPTVHLTPDQHGVIAIFELDRRGHDLLAQFEFQNGAERKQVKRFIGTAVELFTGGITDLEAKIVRGEEVSWQDIGWAALDVGLIVGTVTAVSKAIKAGKVAKGVSLTAKVGGAFKTIGQVLKTVSVIGGVSVVALVVYDPSLVVSGAGLIAEAIRLPGWMGVATLWTIVGLILMTILEVMWRIMRRFLSPLRILVRTGAWAGRRLAKARARA